MLIRMTEVKIVLQTEVGDPRVLEAQRGTEISCVKPLLGQCKVTAGALLF